MWFEVLTGFREGDAEDVASRFVVEGEMLSCRVNGRPMRAGRFEMPSLAELRGRLESIGRAATPLRMREVVADVQALHTAPAAAGAFFQVASQFNMLEMTSPEVIPEDGIDRYEADHTQGPACAIACGAGTIYRNYLVPVDGRIGQSADHQLNGLAELTDALGVDVEVRNGYALPSPAQLETLSQTLRDVDEPRRDTLMGHLRIGLQWDTEVTLHDAGHIVTQAYCSALPIAYTGQRAENWESFARLVLDAAYEATFAAAALNAHATGNRTAYLTLIGGGAFGNPTTWIIDALRRARQRFANTDVDLVVVSHGSPNPRLRELLHSWADHLFAERPRQWGYRGDPYLWNELRESLRTTPVPHTRGELEDRIRREVLRLCGVDIASTDEEAVRVERYPTEGMSGGHVSTQDWKERFVPLLVGRFDPDATQR